MNREENTDMKLKPYLVAPILFVLCLKIGNLLAVLFICPKLLLLSSCIIGNYGVSRGKDVTL